MNENERSRKLALLLDVYKNHRNRLHSSEDQIRILEDLGRFLRLKEVKLFDELFEFQETLDNQNGKKRFKNDKFYDHTLYDNFF